MLRRPAECDRRAGSSHYTDGGGSTPAPSAVALYARCPVLLVGPDAGRVVNGLRVVDLVLMPGSVVERVLRRADCLALTSNRTSSRRHGAT